MKGRYTCLFPSSGNLFYEGWRLFIVNYFWLLFLVAVLCTVTYADKVGDPALKGLYQMLLAAVLCAFCILYCLYWYQFGFIMSAYCKKFKNPFGCGLVLSLWGIPLNVTVVVLIYKLDFTKTEVITYNLNAMLVQLLLLLSVPLSSVLCGLGSVAGWEKADGTNVLEHVSEK